MSTTSPTVAESQASPTRRRWLAAFAGSGTAALLAFHVALSLSSVPVAELLMWWHYWSEVGLAIEYAETGDFPIAAFPITDQPQMSRGYKREFFDTMTKAGLKPWHVIGKVPSTPATGERHVLRRFDDPGRPLLLGILFRLIGGTAPFLIFWMAVLPALALLVWTVFELASAGRPAAGVVLGLLLATSCYVAEALALTYNSSGFYLLGVLLLVPLAVYAALHPRPTWRGLAVRGAVIALALGVFILCRGGAVLLLPGYGLAIAIAARRLEVSPSARRPQATRWLRAALIAVLLPLPWLAYSAVVTRMAEATFAKYASPGKPLRHEIWCSIWKGLGDFDRTKGHVWSDDFIRRAIAESGGHGYMKLTHERMCRDRFVRDVREDPAWYAGILRQRLSATVAQTKLWPWKPRDGVAWTRGTREGEGLIDSYYGLTTTADGFELAGRRFESPVSLLLLPLLLVAFGAAARSAAREPLRGAVLVLAPVAVSTLTLPVLVTTAGGVETQAFAVVYFLAWGFVAEEAVRYAGRALGAARTRRLALAEDAAALGD